MPQERRGGRDVDPASGERVDGRGLVVAVAGDQPLAHKNAQIARQRSIGIVDRLVLANQTAQIILHGARPAFLGGIGQRLIDPEGESRRQGQRQQADEVGDGCCQHRDDGRGDTHRPHRQSQVDQEEPGGAEAACDQARDDGVDA